MILKSWKLSWSWNLENSATFYGFALVIFQVVQDIATGQSYVICAIYVYIFIFINMYKKITPFYN